LALSLALFLALASPLASRLLATGPDAAQEMFAHAKAEASQEHKHVLIVFSDSYCPNCKLYDRFLDDPQMKPITERAFVIEHIDMDKTEGGANLRKVLATEDKSGSVPFMVMTDENGQPIVDSNRNGNPAWNIGYPALPEEIAWYIEMLTRAAPGLSSKELAATRVWLRVHAPPLSRALIVVKFKPPLYPPRAIASSLSGEVDLDLTLLATGEQREVLARRGPQLLRDAAMESAKNSVFQAPLPNHNGPYKLVYRFVLDDKGCGESHGQSTQISQGEKATTITEKACPQW